jgi:hypothetical protein
LSRQDHRNYDAVLERLRQERQSVQKQEHVSSGDIALWCLAGVMAVALYLAPEKTPMWVLAGVLCMALLATHPTLYLPWVKNAPSSKLKAFRSLIAMSGMLSIVGIYGWLVSPPKHRHTLDAKERSLFEEPLKEQKEPREEIQITCPQADENTCVYAGQFVNLFREAGWKVHDNHVQRVTMSNPTAGTFLFKHGSGKLNPDDWRSGLWMAFSASFVNTRQAFVNIGVEPESGSNPELPEGIIAIYFGSEKPDESERTLLTDTMRKVERQWREGTLPRPK